MSSTPRSASQSAPVCDLSIATKYSQSPIVQNAQENLNWCQTKQKLHNIVVSKTFGSAPRDVVAMWPARQCDELLVNGATATCESKYGLSFINKWRRDVVNVTQSGKVSCFRSPYGHHMCKLMDVVIDFSRMTTAGRSRSFSSGFLQVPLTSGDVHVVKGVMADVKGWRFEGDGKTKADLEVTSPVFVNSNDDIGNLMHNMNDVMTVWAMLKLSQRDPRESILLNIDGLRQGGPGGRGHRLMYPDRPDALGPFRGYFLSWFNTIMKAKDYGNKKVKFREVYFHPTPGYPWVWMDYNIEAACSLIGPSSIFQSFQLSLMRHWKGKFGENSMLSPPTTSTNVLLNLRKADPKKGASAKARCISNSRELIKELSTIDRVNVIPIDFSNLSFEDQVKLSSNSSIIVGMHGAGLGHIFHQAIGNPNCCSLIEIFPKSDERQSYEDIRVFGNTARHLGLHYFSYHINSPPLSSSGESKLDIDAVKKLVKMAVYLTKNKPACLASDSSV